jgi:hypothetical protein
MKVTRPARRKGVTTREIGGETLLYGDEGKAIHVLNPTAKLIWDLCDKEHEIADMERVIRSRFSVPDDQDVVGDVRRTLEELADKGLLEEVD